MDIMAPGRFAPRAVAGVTHNEAGLETNSKAAQHIGKENRTQWL